MEFKNNTKHRYKTIQGLRSFKNTLPKNVKKIISKKGHIYSETLDNWRYIVGDDLFKVCFPKSFKNSNRFSPSYLNIMVKRGNEVDLEYSKKSILDKLNSYLGYNAVEKLKFITLRLGTITGISFGMSLMLPSILEGFDRYITSPVSLSGNQT